MEESEDTPLEETEDTSLKESEDTPLEEEEDTSLGEEEVTPVGTVEHTSLRFVEGSCISDGQRVIVTFYDRGLNKFSIGAKIFHFFIYSVISFPTGVYIFPKINFILPPPPKKKCFSGLNPLNWGKQITFRENK